MRRLGAIFLVLLFVGCTRAPEDATTQPLAPAAETGTRAPAFETPVTPPLARLDVTLTVEERWVRPEDTVRANATSAASAFEWYLATRNPLTQLRDPGPFAITPGGTQTLGVRELGRHGFALEDPEQRLYVSIREGAIPLRLEARIVDDAFGRRFAPEELVGGPGSLVTIANDLSTLATLRRVDAMLPLGQGENEVSFLLPDVVGELGDYDLVVVARDGAGAVGNASARLIYDNRKPDADRSFGPFAGRFVTSVPGQTEPIRHAFTSAHDLLSFRATLTVASDAPAPASVRMSLLDAEGTTLASTEGGEIMLTNMPRGDHTFLVEPVAGVLVDHRIEASGVWDLQPPASFFRHD